MAVTHAPAHAARRTDQDLIRWDLLLAGAGMLVAVLIAALPSNLAMAWAGVTILFIAPGYALLQAIVARPRGWHVVAAIGLSIPVVGLLALATTILPSGFQPAWIITSVTIGVLFLLFVAWRRRVRYMRA